MKKFQWIEGLVAFVLSSLPMEATAQFAYGPRPVNAMGLFAGFKTDQSGNFTPLAGSPFGPDTGLASIAVNPVTNLLYAYYFDPPSRSNPNRIQGRVQPYRINSAGTPEPIAALPGPWSIGFDPSGKYFYEFFSTGRPYIGLAVFTVGPDGSLTPIPGSPFTDPTGGFDVTNSLFFHPNGKYVYALGYPPQTGVPGRIRLQAQSRRSIVLSANEERMGRGAVKGER